MTARKIQVLQAGDVQPEEKVNVLVVANDADIGEL